MIEELGKDLESIERDVLQSLAEVAPTSPVIEANWRALKEYNRKAEKRLLDMIETDLVWLRGYRGDCCSPTCALM
jgi:hypothetical protein